MSNSARDINVPTKEDELRKELKDRFRYTTGLRLKTMPPDVEYHTPKGLDNFLDMAMQLITAYGDQRELEGRIAQMQSVQYTQLGDLYGTEVVLRSSIENDIAGLKAKQQECK